MVYVGTDLLATWGLGLEFGVSGVPNLCYIVFVASGAYIYGVLTVGPPSQFGGAETYILGFHLPIAVAMIVAVGVSAILGVIVGLVGLRRLRLDYMALTFLIVAFVASALVSADTGMFNGPDGLSLIPNPLGSVGGAAQDWAYVGIVAAACVAAVILTGRLSGGPYGRTLRAIRDDEEAALAIGKHVMRERLVVQAVGAALAGLSGALLVGFIGGWSPAAWTYDETLAFMTAVIVGGRGSNRGAFVGTVLVSGALLQGVQYLPQLPGRPGLTGDVGWIIAGLLTIGFLFLRPQGLLPETRPRYLAHESRQWLPRAIRRPVRGALALAGGYVPTVRLAVTTPGAAESAASLNGMATLTDGAAPAPGSVAAPAPAAAAAMVQARVVVIDGVGSETAGTRGARRSVPAGQPVLVVDSIERRFGGLRAVDGASFTVPAGAVVGLIGPNGAGKSTALAVVSGFLAAEAGSVHLAGRDITRLRPERRAELGLVRTFQLSREFGRLTTLENLLVAAPPGRGDSALGALIGPWAWRDEEERRIERAWELLRFFGLEKDADRPAAQLSGGQKRLVEVMRGLMADPLVLLLDEPMAGLSRVMSERVEQACLQLKAAGRSVLLVEHELGSVERLCDNVVVMAQGSVLAQGLMAELRRSREVQEAYVVG